MKDHVCALKGDKPYFMFTSISKLRRDLTFKNIWRHFVQISENTPGKIYFDSMASLHNEKRRHAESKFWWIIHPFSRWRFIWDVIMTIIFMLLFLTIPFSVCFIVLNHDSLRLDNINILLYTFCWIDIVCNCFTGYYDEKQMHVELRPLKIFTNYLKTYLILDIISSLPWDHITLPWRKLPGQNSGYIVPLINLLPLFKLIRYPYVNTQIFWLFVHFEIMYFYFQMFSTFMLGFFIMYWASCLCYLIPVLVLHFSNSSPNECPECWMTGLDSDTVLDRFQYAVFIVVEKLSSTGYGIYEPHTNGHFVLSCFLMIIGRMLECYVAVMLLQIKAGKEASSSKFQQIINQVAAYTRQKQLPKHMKVRLMTYYYYRFRSSYFREKLILSNVTEQLRQDIALQSSHRLVENVAIFKSLPNNVLRSIVRNLKFELYLPNDVIVKAGAQGDCMFFLSAGTVAVLTPTGKEICHLDDGAHFGEVALLVPDQRRVASVVAIEVCEVYRLDRKDFRKCIAVHSELFMKIEKIASDRIERAVMIEEQHKRYVMRNSKPDDERTSIMYY